MASEPSEKARAIRLSTDLFQHIELFVYVALGIVLCVTSVLALGSAALLLLEGIRDWSSTGPIFLIVDRLMFVLMLIEILHTVRGSVRSGELTPEPLDRKSTRLNSSRQIISYAVFCLKKKKIDISHHQV